MWEGGVALLQGYGWIRSYLFYFALLYFALLDFTYLTRFFYVRASCVRVFELQCYDDLGTYQCAMQSARAAVPDPWVVGAVGI